MIETKLYKKRLFQLWDGEGNLMVDLAAVAGMTLSRDVSQHANGLYQWTISIMLKQGGVLTFTRWTAYVEVIVAYVDLEDSWRKFL